MNIKYRMKCCEKEYTSIVEIGRISKCPFCQKKQPESEIIKNKIQKPIEPQSRLTCCGYIVLEKDCITPCPKCGSETGICEEEPKRERVFMGLPSFSGDKSYENREWGSFEVLLDDPEIKVKKIVVHKDKRLSLQLHTKRQELWYVASGSGEVQKGNNLIDISAGDEVSIDKYEVHRVKNNGLIDLVIIEIQTGVCQEDDIIRIEDDFGRVE